MEILLAMAVIFNYPLKLALVWDAPEEVCIYSTDTRISTSCPDHSIQWREIGICRTVGICHSSHICADV